LLAKYEPELASKILDSIRNEHSNEYCIGFSASHDTYLIDKMIEHTKATEKGVNTPDKDREDR